MRSTYNSIEIKSKEIMKYNNKKSNIEGWNWKKKYTKHYSSE
jgi:hypothetical protein